MKAPAAVAALGGVVIAPMGVRVALIAVVLLVVLVMAAAAAHDMRPGAAAALYGGRAVLWVARGCSLALVESPVRVVHRAWVHGDVAVRGRRTAARVGYRLSAHQAQGGGATPTPKPASTAVPAGTSMLLADPPVPAQVTRADLVGQSRHAA